MKNKEVIGILNNFNKLETLKLGGVITKSLLKNKRVLLSLWEEIDETRKKIIEQYTEDGVLDESKANEEFGKVLNLDVNATFEIIPEEKLDQFNDITLEQYELLSYFSK